MVGFPKVLNFISYHLGFYMYVDASSRKPGEKARLLTPLMPKTTSKCFEFWYHMYGSAVRSFNLYKKTGSSVGVRIWSKSGNQGDEWLAARVSVWSPLRAFRLSFEATVGGSTGDIAIDDVQIFDGKCAVPGMYIEIWDGIGKY